MLEASICDSSVRQLDGNEGLDRMDEEPLDVHYDAARTNFKCHLEASAVYREQCDYLGASSGLAYLFKPAAINANPNFRATHCLNRRCSSCS